MSAQTRGFVIGVAIGVAIHYFYVNSMRPMTET